LERSASTTERGKGGALLSTAYPYDKRCAPGAAKAPFSFGEGERFKLKGSMAKGRYADAWIYLGDKDSFDAKALNVRMDFSENDAAMHFALDPPSLAPRSAAALCPDAVAPGKPGAHCAIFILTALPAPMTLSATRNSAVDRPIRREASAAKCPPRTSGPARRDSAEAQNRTVRGGHLFQNSHRRRFAPARPSDHCR
jgi:hypothetical protein